MTRPTLDVARRLFGQPEFWSALTMILWAKWLYWGSNDLTENSTYSVLTGLLSEGALEWIAFVLGSVQLGTIIWNQRWPRFATGSAASVFWLALANSVWMATPNAPGAALALGFGLMNMALTLLLCCHRSER